MKTANYSILRALLALLISVAAARSAEVEYGFSVTGSMQSARSEHTASLLSNGKVLVAGGTYNAGSYRSSSELYDPTVGTWSGTGALLSTRASHTATVLSNGEVLVTGGLASTDGAYLSSSELYDPATGSWSSTGAMSYTRSGHTATLLGNGNVLVTGGVGNLSSAELYNPTTGQWTATGSMTSPRANHTATLLDNGKVLVTGGNYNGALASAELYDPTAGTWTTVASMSVGRGYHTATKMANGKVLVRDYGYQIYDPNNNTWTSLIEIYYSPSAAISLPNGKVWTYYSGIADVFDPSTGAWSSAGQTQNYYFKEATLLTNGKILLTGNYMGLISAMLYGPVEIPSIQSQPTSVVAGQGGRASFTVTATGVTPTYQWRKNGSDIPGATDASYNLTNVQYGDAGTYTVALSNSAGNVTSTPATLTVVAPVTITAQPVNATVNQGGSTTFSVTATGGTLTYQWKKWGSNIPGATSSTLTLTDLDASDSGTYTVVVSNAGGSVTSNEASLTVRIPLAITSQPSDQSTSPGGSVYLSVSAVGNNLSYQWKKDGEIILGATNSYYYLYGVRSSYAGDYTVVVSDSVSTITSRTAKLTVIEPVSIVSQPTNVTADPGGSATFSVTATGGALTYQWQKRSQYGFYESISGATGPTLTLNDINISNAGHYVVFISNGGGSVTSFPASLTLRLPLAITSQPDSRTVDQGDYVGFYVDATGDDLSYQWQKNGIDIPEANGPWLEFYEAQITDTGDYTVVVSDSSGSLTSRVAGLSVIPQVEIINQPTSVSANVGESASFSVTATGDNLTYQWAKEGVNIPGATAETLDLSEIKSSDEGDYTVIVSNGQDDETSNPARLTVIGPAAINVQPTNIAVGQGGNAIFSVGATGGSLSYQWQRNGVDIMGAIEATLEVIDVQHSNLGDYSVIVENSEGSVTSNTVSLTLTDYEYNENEDGSGITLSRYIGPAGDVTIPTTIAGYTVTSIGEYAFTEYGDSITRVVVPNTVTRIEEGAFAGCTALTSIVIPDSVTWIGDYAFADCLSLTEVTIPDSVTSIGQEAFSGCDGLIKVDLPDRFLTQLSKIGLPGQLATTILTEGMSKLLSNHEGFIAALAGEILSKGDEYGFAAKNDLATLATKEEMLSLATKTELTTALSESKTAGINSVLSNPNLWTLYTTSQIQNMAVGDLVLTKNIGGTFTLNYDIEQSSDLKNWTSYRVKAEELTGLPTDKAFVRIKVK
jgi:hypothetical protein